MLLIMIKKFLVITITFILVFITVPPVWAENNYSFKTSETFSVDKSVFFTKIENTKNISNFSISGGWGLGGGYELFVLIVLLPIVLFVITGILILMLLNESKNNVIQHNSNTEKDKRNTKTWMNSLLIPGLGQMSMGNGQRGFKFLLLELLFISFYFIPIFSCNSFYPSGLTFSCGSGSEAILKKLFLLGTITIYSWNIFDAFIMSSNPDDLEEKLKNELLSKSELIKNIKVSGNGYISVKVYSF